MVKEEKKKSPVLDLIESVIIAVVLALVIRFFLFEPFYIPSGSMEPTLQVQDKIIVNKLVYRFKEPARGDIIVFELPMLEPDLDYIKRVIGLPGETLEIKDSTVYINGQPLEEDYLPSDLRFMDFGPITIPDDSYFMLGDNRNNSQDSRIWGTLSKDHIIGKAVLIFWPFNRFGLLK
jgi:signal peptidase I